MICVELIPILIGFAAAQVNAEAQRIECMAVLYGRCDRRRSPAL